MEISSALSSPSRSHPVGTPTPTSNSAISEHKSSNLSAATMAAAAAAAMATLNCMYKPMPTLMFDSYASAAMSGRSGLIATAGCDINANAQVYLLYEMPVTMLAKRFLTASSGSQSDGLEHECAKLEVISYFLYSIII
jgi:hypothetical protein